MEFIRTFHDLESFFADADYIDIKVVEGNRSLREFIAGMLSYYPWWIVLLYRIREIIVSLLGLAKHEKPETLPCLTAQDISQTPGDAFTFSSDPFITWWFHE